MKKSVTTALVCVATILLASSGWLLVAEDNAKTTSTEDVKSTDKKDAVDKKATAIPGKPVPLNKQKTVLLDVKGNRVLLKAKVAIREALLEMLCCPVQTKEHESILAVDAKAYVIHGALVALGADPGSPVKLGPDKEFKPPTGPKIDIYLNWIDEKGKAHRDKAQSWVRNNIRRFYVYKMAKLPDGLTLPKKGELSYDAKHGELLWYNHMSKEKRDKALAMSKDAEFQKAVKQFYDQSQPREMEADFVFAGSQLFKDDQTGEQFYAAEGGDLICVANFPSAMIDIAMRSSSTGNDSLQFEAYTERVPPIDTEVTIELIPQLKDQNGPKDQKPVDERKPVTDQKPAKTPASKTSDKAPNSGTK